MRRISYLPAAACCLIIGLIGHPAVAASSTPAKGMSMDAVAQIHGQPRTVRAAVGDPPITRWIYDEYTVYFEHKHVIHSVSARDDIAATTPDTAGTSSEAVLDEPPATD